MHTRILKALQDGYQGAEVVTLVGTTRARVRDAQRVLGYVAQQGNVGVFPTIGLLDKIQLALERGRPREWVARALDIPLPAVASASRFLGMKSNSLRSWTLKTYDWVEECLGAGMTVAQAARVVKTLDETVERWFPGGIPISSSWGSHLEEHDWLDVEVLVMQGATVQEIAVALNMPVPVVRVAIVEIGYPKGALEGK